MLECDLPLARFRMLDKSRQIKLRATESTLNVVGTKLVRDCLAGLMRLYIRGCGN